MDGNLPTLTSRSRKSLRIWPGNPRKTLPDLTDLTASIARRGVLTPLLIRPLATPDGDVTHEVIAGQCRYLAAGLAGIDEVPVNEREVDDCVALEIALTENAGREAPSPLEEAEALDIMLRVHGRTREQIADKLGRPLRWVERRLSLLALVEGARAWLRAGRLPLAHAMQLAALDPATQARVVERHEKSPELPASKSFAHEITYLLHLIGSAPFNTADAKLPGGACGKCSKRSDSQVDLFDTGRESGAHCLDATCWDTKVTANIERAKKAAEKRKLPVFEGPKAREVVVEVFDGRISDVYASKLTAKAPTSDAQPVAVAVTERGRVVDLYEKIDAPPTGDDEASDERRMTPAEIERDQKRKAELAEQRRKWAEEEEKTAARAKAVAALPLEQLARLAALCTHVYREEFGFEAAGIAVPEKREDFGAWARSLDPEVVVRAVLASRVLDYLDDKVGADSLPADTEPLALEILGPIYGVAKPEEPEEPPPTKTKKPSKKGKAAAVEATVAPVTSESTAPAAQTVASVEVPPIAPEGRTLRVGDAVFARDGATWVVKAIVGDEVRLDHDGLVRITVVQRDTITLDAADLWRCDDLPTTEASSAVETVRVWITADAWDALASDDRDALEEPIGGQPVAWQGTEGFVFADVPRDEVLVALRGEAEAAGITLHESAERPVVAQKAAKKASAASAETSPPRETVPVGAVVHFKQEGDADGGDFGHTVARIVGESAFFENSYYDDTDERRNVTWNVPLSKIRREGNLWRSDSPLLKALWQTTLDVAPAAAEAPPAVTTLRVPRGPWLLHRSELRDTSTGPLHKKWLPVDQDRVATVPRGDALVGIIRAFCIAQRVPLWVDGVQVSPPAVEAAPVKATRAKKGGSK